MDNINQNQIRGDDDLSDTMQDQPANVIHTNNSNFRAEGGMSSESSSQRGDYDYDTNRDLVNADQVKSPGRPDFRYGDNDKDALDQIFLYDGFAKNKQAWGFFNNQTFNAEALDFDEEEFYGENWKTLLIKRMSAQFGEIDKMQRVEAVDTYEPKLVSLEISQLVEEERENFI